MQAPLTNPDSRPLPPGWAEHFDSQRAIWYYVDLNSEPPRVAFVHPGDTTQPQPLSAPSLGMVRLPQNHEPQRPVGPREASTRPRRATVAQQLYASSMLSYLEPEDAFQPPSKGSHRSSSHQASTSGTSLPAVEVPSSSSFARHNNSTLVPPTLCSPNPRSFDGTQFSSRPGPRRSLTDNAPGLTTSSGSVFRRTSQDLIAPFTPNAFYHHSISMPPPHIPPTCSNLRKDVQLGTQLRPTKLTPCAPERDHCPRSCFDNPSLSPLYLLPPIPSNSVAGCFVNRNLYTATTEDNLMVMPTRMTDQASNKNWNAPIDVSCLSDSQYVPPGYFQSRRNISTLTDQAIIQPKPTKPLKGVSLNLQVLVAGEAPLPETVTRVKTKRRVPLKNFGLVTSRKLFLKCKAGTSRDGERTHGSQEIALNSDKDESFVLVDKSQLPAT